MARGTGVSGTPSPHRSRRRRSMGDGAAPTGEARPATMRKLPVFCAVSRQCCYTSTIRIWLPTIALAETFGDFREAFLDFEKALSGLRESLSGVPSPRTVMCERRDSNPDRLLYRNLNPVKNN